MLTQQMRPMKGMTRFFWTAVLCFSLLTISLSQETVERNLELDSYHSINVSGGIDIYITQGPEASTKVRADTKVVEFITTEVRDETLFLSLKNFSGKSDVLEAYVTMPIVKSIVASGSSDVYSKGLIEMEELVINAAGSSDVDLELQGAALAVTMEGSSDLDLEGSVTDVTFVAKGSSDITAKGFKAENCILTMTGASDAVIGVSKMLSVEAHGASDVRYIGDPEIVHKVAKGASSVKKI